MTNLRCRMADLSPRRAARQRPFFTALAGMDVAPASADRIQREMMIASLAEPAMLMSFHRVAADRLDLARTISESW